MKKKNKSTNRYMIALRIAFPWLFKKEHNQIISEWENPNAKGKCGYKRRHESKYEQPPYVSDIWDGTSNAVSSIPDPRLKD